MTFPQVNGTSLDGRIFHLPGDLDGVLNLLLIAFQPNQQRDLNSWMPYAEALCQQFPDLHYYEIPAMWTFSPARQESIMAGMRMGLPDPAAHARTITIFTDLDQFNHALELFDQSLIYILLIDRSGAVLWRAEDRYTRAKGESLRGILQNQQDDGTK